MVLNITLYQWNGFTRNKNIEMDIPDKYYTNKLLDLFMTRKDLFESIIVSCSIKVNDKIEVNKRMFNHYIPKDSNIPHLCHENPIDYLNDIFNKYRISK